MIPQEQYKLAAWKSPAEAREQAKATRKHCHEARKEAKATRKRRHETYHTRRNLITIIRLERDLRKEGA